MLVIFSGLPGTGKTTTAKILAKRLSAVYLRIDSIEKTLAEGHIDYHQMNDAGYAVAYAVAGDNLRLGADVIADSVNPLEITRSAWRSVADRAGVAFLQVEFVCSHQTEHRRRIETRKADIPGFVLPTWANVVSREYEPWKQDHLICDTAVLSAEESADLILQGVLKIRDAGNR